MNILKDLKVMYVEDNADTRAGIERFLKRRFGKVFLADSAEQGIELFHKFNPDIAIVDILLPGMGGLEMIQKLRETDTRCRFLITSSVTDIDTILKAVDLDIESYIVKPIDTEDFEEKLQKAGQSVLSMRSAPTPVESFAAERKSEKEEEIRKSFIKIIKEKSGRGPRDAVVFISGDTVEITAYGILNASDRTLLTDIKNTGHVEEGRRLFYHAIENDISAAIKDVTGIAVEMTSIKVNASKDRETAVFRISRR